MAVLTHILIRLAAAEQDDKLGTENNNGRKVCATSLIAGEEHIRDPLWRVPAVFATGAGGFEVATLSEFSAQDRHKHAAGAEMYTVLRGELEIYINDEGPLVLGTGDEVIVLPGTVHEIIRKRRPRRRLLVRVHALACHGADDKYVQLEPGGDWKRWSALSQADRARAWRKQGYD